MADGCRQCGEDAGSGLCSACAGRLDECANLLPQHVISTTRVDDAGAWLIDPWGRAHPVRRDRTAIGRTTDGDIAVFHHTVSREHAVVRESDGGWTLRDLGSKNGTRVDGDRVDGRRALVDRVSVQLGMVPLVFRTGADAGAFALGAAFPPSTTEMPGLDGYRCELCAPSGELRLVLSRAVGGDESDPGLLSLDGGDRSEVGGTLPPVEFELLKLLAARAQQVAAAASPVHRCISSRELARRLPFRSQYANEENVRQAVRRARTALRRLGVDDLIEAHPPHGYCVTWTPAR